MSRLIKNELFRSALWLIYGAALFYIMWNVNFSILLEPFIIHFIGVIIIFISLIVMRRNFAGLQPFSECFGLLAYGLTLAVVLSRFHIHSIWQGFFITFCLTAMYFIMFVIIKLNRSVSR
jgi:hypothetical protein